MAIYLGSFRSTERVEQAMTEESHRIVVDYLNHGSYGRSFSEIQVSLVGAIRASVDTHDSQGRVTGQRQVLFEFHIRTIDSRADQAARLPDGYHANAEGTFIRERHTHMYTVKHRYTIAIPDPPPAPAPFGVQHDEERSPEWARTRVPLFDRRDDAPVRRPGDPPYSFIMRRSLPWTVVVTPPIDQAVEASGNEEVRADSGTASGQGSPRHSNTGVQIPQPDD